MSSPASLLSMSTLPFKSPILLTAKRSSGFVDIPTYNDNGIEEWNSAMGVLPPGDDSFSDFANLDGSKGVFAGPTHLNRTRTMGGNIVVLEPDGEPPQAFWLQRKIGLSSHGVIRLGYKLRRNTKASFKGPSNAWQLDMNEEGETSLVKITIMHSSILDMKVDCHEGQNPLNELSALQMIANHSNIEDAHVVGTRLVGTCTSYVYSVLPYYPDGTLLHYCVSKGNLEEPVARFLFKQILQVSKDPGIFTELLFYYQKGLSCLTIHNRG